MTGVRPLPRSAPDIADAVLGATTTEHAIHLPLIGLVALAAYASLLLGVRQATLCSRAAEPATQPVKWNEFDLAEVRPPTPPAEAARAVRDRRATFAKAHEASVHAVQSSGARAAQAAAVVAQSPESGAPVDLTADAVVTGKAIAYAGGMTASRGNSALPVATVPATLQSGQTTSSAHDRSRPVSLATENWACPWPREADAQQIDEQTVILRVVVTAAGDPEKATVLADPGHGFAPAAVACAMRTHFTPARDPRGEPTRSTSPPIRIRFTR